MHILHSLWTASLATLQQGSPLLPTLPRTSLLPLASCSPVPKSPHAQSTPSTSLPEPCLVLHSALLDQRWFLIRRWRLGWLALPWWSQWGLVGWSLMVTKRMWRIRRGRTRRMLKWGGRSRGDLPCHQCSSQTSPGGTAQRIYSSALLSCGNEGPPPLSWWRGSAWWWADGLWSPSSETLILCIGSATCMLKQSI